jgi:hypothetical protein
MYNTTAIKDGDDSENNKIDLNTRSFETDDVKVRADEVVERISTPKTLSLWVQALASARPIRHKGGKSDKDSDDEFDESGEGEKGNDEKPRIYLLKTLRMSRGCLSSNPKDKLYGIIPLLHYPNVVSPLRPDHALPCEHVYANLAVYLYHENRPEVLREGFTIRS